MTSKTEGNAACWQPGDHVLYQATIMGQPSATIPVTVVAAEPDLLVLYLASGTMHSWLVVGPGQPLPRVIPPDVFVRMAKQYVVEEWEPSPILLVTRPGRAHAVHHNWSQPDWLFQRWYVNLQDPVERRDWGFRTTDHFLDVVVQADRTWCWKDEDELAEAVAVGRVSADRAGEIRREGERVIADVEAGLPPFDGSWRDWRPNPEWSIPRLPDELPGY